MTICFAYIRLSFEVTHLLRLLLWLLTSRPRLLRPHSACHVQCGRPSSVNSVGSLAFQDTCFFLNRQLSEYSYYTSTDEITKHLEKQWRSRRVLSVGLQWGWPLSYSLPYAGSICCTADERKKLIILKYLCKVSGISPNLSNLAQFQVIGRVEVPFNTCCIALRYRC